MLCYESFLTLWRNSATTAFDGCSGKGNGFTEAILKVKDKEGAAISSGIQSQGLVTSSIDTFLNGRFVTGDCLITEFLFSTVIDVMACDVLHLIESGGAAYHLIKCEVGVIALHILYSRVRVSVFRGLNGAGGKTQGSDEKKYLSHIGIYLLSIGS